MKHGKRMTADEYLAHPAVGSTTLKLAYESMAKFKAQIDGEIEKTETTYFDIGHATHSAILEQDFSSHICGPDEAKNTKIWKEFVLKNPGKVCLQPHHFKTVKGMYDSFFKHPLASKITNRGLPECSFFTKLLGHDYKARTDYLVEDGQSLYIVDYKTAEDASYEKFQRAIESYGYDLSAGHYIRVIESIVTDLPIANYFWIVQEKDPPYELAVYRMDQECRERSLAIVDNLYKKIADAHKTGLWPSRFPAEIMDIDVDFWVINKGKRNI